MGMSDMANCQKQNIHNQLSSNGFHSKLCIKFPISHFHRFQIWNFHFQVEMDHDFSKAGCIRWPTVALSRPNDLFYWFCILFLLKQMTHNEVLHHIFVCVESMVVTKILMTLSPTFNYFHSRNYWTSRMDDGQSVVSTEQRPCVLLMSLLLLSSN